MPEIINSEGGKVYWPTGSELSAPCHFGYIVVGRLSRGDLYTSWQPRSKRMIGRSWSPRSPSGAHCDVSITFLITDIQNVRKESLFWLTLVEGPVYNWLALRQGRVAEGPGKREAAHGMVAWKQGESREELEEL